MSADKTIHTRTDADHCRPHIRLPHADPAERVTPARPATGHVAVSIVALWCMVMAAGTALFLQASGRPFTTEVVVTLGSVTLGGMAVMWLADRWYARRPR
jgi:hypothetical protein